MLLLLFDLLSILLIVFQIFWELCIFLLNKFIVIQSFSMFFYMC